MFQCTYLVIAMKWSQTHWTRTYVYHLTSISNCKGSKVFFINKLMMAYLILFTYRCENWIRFTAKIQSYKRYLYEGLRWIIFTNIMLLWWLLRIYYKDLLEVRKTLEHINWTMLDTILQIFLADHGVPLRMRLKVHVCAFWPQTTRILLLHLDVVARFLEFLQNIQNATFTSLIVSFYLLPAWCHFKVFLYKEFYNLQTVWYWILIPIKREHYYVDAEVHVSSRWIQVHWAYMEFAVFMPAFIRAYVNLFNRDRPPRIEYVVGWLAQFNIFTNIWRLTIFFLCIDIRIYYQGYL